MVRKRIGIAGSVPEEARAVAQNTKTFIFYISYTTLFTLVASREKRMIVSLKKEIGARNFIRKINERKRRENR